MPVKSFRGLIKNEATETVALATRNGSTGYRIKKLQIISKTPYASQIKGVLKIYTVPQTGTPDAVVDFSDQTLLAVSTYHDQPTAEDMAESKTIIFDNMTFNQDIYITYRDIGVSAVPVSYYFELEQIKLDLSENTVATLKDIRNITR